MEEPIYQVVLSPSAQKDLLNIYTYLMDEVGLQTAEHVKEGLEFEIKSLALMPSAKGLLQGVHSSKHKYRRSIKWSYRVIFTIDQSDQKVIVVRIDHVSRDPERLKELA